MKNYQSQIKLKPDRYRGLMMALFISIFVGCGHERKDTVNELQVPEVDSTMTANTFLSFDNPQASLTAGEYYLVAASKQAGVSETYQLTVEFDDGSRQVFEGSWQDASGTGLDNPRHKVVIQRAAGLKAALSSTSDNVLYLIRNEQLIAQADNHGVSTNASLNLASNKVNNEGYARAYYQAVDPRYQRATLQAWKSVNGFTDNNFKRITFRDSKDLGYGRDMFARRRDDGGIAVFVNNYLVQFEGADASSYGRINLEAAINQRSEFLIGTNAIEFSPVDENDPASDFIVKLFTYGPIDQRGLQQRLMSADLDGRGEKFMPTMCLACHGGAMEPLNPDGSFSMNSLRSAKMNLLEPATFNFSAQTGFSEQEQQSGIKLVNQLAFESFQQLQQQVAGTKGEWNAEFAMQLIAGHYGGDMSASTFDNNYIPPGWQQDGDRPDGVELLYQEVIEPHCISCHMLRGTDAGESLLLPIDYAGHQVQIANAINFSSFEKFISYSEPIIDKVYRRGRMPMSLINYTRFWATPQGAPSFLASFLPGFDVLDENGNVVPPSRPLAIVGASRTVTSPVQLDASGSVFSANYSWTIVSQPVGSVASFSDQNSATPIFTADLNGVYVLQLITSNVGGQSLPSQVSLKIDSTLSPTQNELNFVDNIVPILNKPVSGKSCVDCHTPDGDFPSIPVYYADTNAHLYQDVLARIDFNEPENSLLIRKPANIQHGGGVRLDRGSESGQIDYQTFVNWIRSGAPCGNDPTICDG